MTKINWFVNLFFKLGFYLISLYLVEVIFGGILIHICNDALLLVSRSDDFQYLRFFVQLILLLDS